MRISEKKKADLLLFVTASGWALSTILIKMFSESLPVYHIMSVRYVMALLIIVIVQHKEIRLVKKSDWLPGIVLGILTFGAFALAIMSLYYTSASKSGFLVAMSVLFVPVVNTIKKRRLPNHWIVISVVLSLIGLFMISGMNGGRFNFGDMLALLCAACYTVYIMIMDVYTKRIHASVLVFIQFLVVAVISVVMMFIFEDINVQSITINWFPLVVIGIFGTAITNFAQVKAQKTASPESVGLILLGEPLFTLIMAAIILQETILLQGVIGAVVMLTAMVITVFAEV